MEPPLGTMSSDDQQQFRTALPGLLEALDDRSGLGALLSADAIHEYRHGSHTDAHRLMRCAVATGHPSRACVDRLTIDLVNSEQGRGCVDPCGTRRGPGLRRHIPKSEQHEEGREGGSA